jgi:hypothetical protein
MFGMIQIYSRYFFNFRSVVLATFILPLVIIISPVLVRQSFKPSTTASSLPLQISSPVNPCTLVDATFSACTSSMVLNVDPGYTNYTWSTGATSTSITVNTSGTYWWETVQYTDNAVSNGDFENSADHYAGFTSSYTKNNSSLLVEGTYAVVKNPNSVHGSFASFYDHTKNDGTGYMMVVNGAPTANVLVWSESVTVQPNTTYLFSIWGASVHPTSPGVLNFSINGTQLGNITLISTTGSWQNFTVRWNSGSNTTATIGIVNQNTASTGNDFALDDIVFAPVCRKNITANLYPNPAKPIITN